MRWLKIFSCGAGCLFLSVLTACGAGFDTKGTLIGGSDSGNSGLSLDAKVETVFQNNCASCHNGAAQNTDTLTNVTDLNALATSKFIVPGDAGASPLYQEVLQGAMPPGRSLDRTDRELIANWMVSLNSPRPSPTPTPQPNPTPTPQPTATPSPTPTPTNPNATFTNISKTILQNRCVGCHGGDGGYSFNNYTNTMKAVTAGKPNSSRLYTSVSSGAMPRGGSLTAAQIQLIYDWILAGAKNN